MSQQKDVLRFVSDTTAKLAAGKASFGAVNALLSNPLLSHLCDLVERGIVSEDILSEMLMSCFGTLQDPKELVGETPEIISPELLSCIACHTVSFTAKETRRLESQLVIGNDARQRLENGSVMLPEVFLTERDVDILHRLGLFEIDHYGVEALVKDQRQRDDWMFLQVRSKRSGKQRATANHTTPRGLECIGSLSDLILFGLIWTRLLKDRQTLTHPIVTRANDEYFGFMDDPDKGFYIYRVEPNAPISGFLTRRNIADFEKGRVR